MNWYKISQAIIDPSATQSEQNIGTPNVNIKPLEPLIQEAARELQAENPGILDNVSDINVDLGYSQFGSVSSNSPNSININMNKIKDQFRQDTGEIYTESNLRHKQALKWLIKQTIIHELGHVQDYNPEDPNNPFPSGETQSTRKQEEWANANPLTGL